MLLKIKKNHLVLLNLVTLLLILILFHCYIEFTIRHISKSKTSTKIEKVDKVDKVDKNQSSISSTRSSSIKYTLSSKLSRKFKSTCGQAADDLGPGQRVVSYSLYRKNGHFTKYASGIEANILSLGEIYNSASALKNGTLPPPWVIRIYSDLKKPQGLIQKYPNVLFWCDIREILPGVYLKFEKAAWRFLVLGDPTVDIFLSRDLDGILTTREKSAVDEWLMSNYSFHSMRDHPFHSTHILAGMWGGNNQILGFKTARKIRQNFIKSRIMNDQAILSKFIWTSYKNHLLVHDSYLCQLYATKSTRPWPTKRLPEWDFVGKPVLRFNDTYLVQKCPIECRPEKHKDWDYC